MTRRTAPSQLSVSLLNFIAFNEIIIDHLKLTSGHKVHGLVRDDCFFIYILTVKNESQFLLMVNFQVATFTNSKNDLNNILAFVDCFFIPREAHKNRFILFLRLFVSSQRRATKYYCLQKIVNENFFCATNHPSEWRPSSTYNIIIIL